MATPPLNGSLEVWPDLAARFSKSALLCGNGLSINVWPAFAYGSLFDQAHDGWLTDEDLALFGETENFERVLSDLNTAIRVNETLAQNEHPQRAVAVSLLPETRRTLARRQADIYARLETDELRFFDATTHPLGYPSLSVPGPNGLQSRPSVSVRPASSSAVRRQL